MPHLAKDAQRVRAETTFDAQLIRHPLVVQSRLRDGLRNIHLEIDHVHQVLQYGGDDARSAWRSGGEPCLAVAHGNDRRHRTQRPLAGGYRIGFATREAKRIGHARLGRKVIHFVVEQDAGSARDDARAKRQVQRIGAADNVARSVHDRKVRRLVAFIRDRVACHDVFACTRALGVDCGRLLVGVLLGHEPARRHLDEVWIAHVLRPVRIR